MAPALARWRPPRLPAPQRGARCLPGDDRPEAWPGAGSRRTGGQPRCPPCPVGRVGPAPPSRGLRESRGLVSMKPLSSACTLTVGPGRPADWSAHPPSSAVPVPTCPLPARPAVALTLSEGSSLRPVLPPWAPPGGQGASSQPRAPCRAAQSPPAFIRSAGLPCRGTLTSPGAGDAAFSTSSEALGPWPPPTARPSAVSQELRAPELVRQDGACRQRGLVLPAERGD